MCEVIFSCPYDKRVVCIINVKGLYPHPCSIHVLIFQVYKGDVTLLPRRIFWGHRLAASNIMRAKDVSFYLQEGLVMTFEKISLIK